MLRRAWAEHDQVGAPFRRAVDDFALGPALAMDALCRSKIALYLQNILCSVLFRLPHFLAQARIWPARSQKTLALPLHLRVRPAIGDVEQADGKRVSWQKRRDGLAHLLDICAVQTTQNTHRCSPCK